MGESLRGSSPHAAHRPKFAYRRPPELGAAAAVRHPVVVVGAGPVGLAAAIDCRLKGLPAAAPSRTRA